MTVVTQSRQEMIKAFAQKKRSGFTTVELETETGITVSSSHTMLKNLIAINELKRVKTKKGNRTIYKYIPISPEKPPHVATVDDIAKFTTAAEPQQAKTEVKSPVAEMMPDLLTSNSLASLQDCVALVASKGLAPELGRRLNNSLLKVSIAHQSMKNALETILHTLEEHKEGHNQNLLLKFIRMVAENANKEFGH